MRVVLNYRTEKEEKFTKEAIIYLISIFGYMKYPEIIGFFPTISEEELGSYLNEMVAIGLLKKVKSFYATKDQIHNGFGETIRRKHYESSCFIRYLMNSEDNEGYLINNVTCIGTDQYPFNTYIVSNNKLYEIAHCSREDINIFTDILSHIDYEQDKNEAEYQRRQKPDAPFIIKEEKNRIIIVDNEEDMEHIHFRKVKLIACRQENRYLLKAGD